MRPLLFTLAAAILLAPFITAQDSLPANAADLPISQLLFLASSALSAGKSASALSLYDYCLERDPTDFATLYKRATVRLATGQWVKAKEGFAEVLAVKEFDQAHWQLAKLHAKIGELVEAKREVDAYMRMHPGKEGKEVAQGNELRAQIKAAQSDLAHARKALKASPPDLAWCQSSTTSALTLSPNSEELRLLRAECHLLTPDYDAAVGDLSRAAALSPALPPHLLLRIALLSSLFLDHGLEIPADSLLSLKRCLASDPDSKPCRGSFKALKAAEKELARLRNWVEGGRWGEAAQILAGSSTTTGLIATLRSLITSYQTPLVSSPSAPAPLPSSPTLQLASPLLTSLVSTLCRAYTASGQTRKSGPACEEALSRNPEDMWGLVGKGDKLLAEENWQEAVHALHAAFEKSGRSDREILGKLQKAQRLLKQSTAKDYYKVLGVSRDADAKAIKKAYRKATLKAHPDKEGGSQAKMAALNEAYEVLSNPELRERFNNGEDPNDQTSGQQQHPFAHHGGGGAFNQFFQQGGQQFFQQGGQTFKFG